jgi:hypothetical protein
MYVAHAIANTEDPQTSHLASVTEKNYLLFEIHVFIQLSQTESPFYYILLKVRGRQCMVIWSQIWNWIITESKHSKS